jgi:hypothetical protein
LKVDIGMYQPYLKYSSIFIGLDFARNKEEPGTAEGRKALAIFELTDAKKEHGCGQGQVHRH